MLSFTNGIQLKAFVYDEASDTYMALNRMPSYEEMLGDDYELAAWEDETFVRFDMEELRDQQLIQQYNDEGEWIFGQISEPWLRSFAVNLYQCFLDTDHMLPPYKCSTFQLIRDIGLRGDGLFQCRRRTFPRNLQKLSCERPVWRNTACFHVCFWNRYGLSRRKQNKLYAVKCCRRYFEKQP